MDYTECRSGYCIPDHLGATYCTFPLFQIAELEFWRHGQPISTRKVADSHFDAYRIVNAMDVPQTWGVWELEFYNDTNCTTLLTNGTAIASSSLPQGFGHSVDHTAPMGLHDTPRTYWQSRPFADPMTFDLHGPAAYAFDGNVTTNWWLYPPWELFVYFCSYKNQKDIKNTYFFKVLRGVRWADCRNPCRADTQWIGLNFSMPTPAKCVRILQDKDQDYALWVFSTLKNNLQGFLGFF